MAYPRDLQDTNPPETQEWLDALESVLGAEGIERANFILERLSSRMSRTGARLPYTITTPYRNTIPSNKEAFKPGDLFMERATRSVSVNGEPLHLLPKEFGLLEYLLLHKDQVVSRRDLSEHVWDEHFDPTSNVIDVLIHRLRKKVDGSRPTKLLHTAPGAGYMLKSERS